MGHIMPDNLETSNPKTGLEVPHYNQKREKLSDYKRYKLEYGLTSITCVSSCSRIVRGKDCEGKVLHPLPECLAVELGLFGGASERDVL